MKRRVQSVVKTLLCGAILTLASCGGERGPEGPQGPAGPPGEPARGDVYCRATTDARAPTWRIVAQCDTAADIPLDGSCSSNSLPSGVYLALNGPVNWEFAGTVAAWECSWFGPSPPDVISSTRVTMCCIAVGPRPTAVMLSDEAP